MGTTAERDQLAVKTKNRLLHSLNPNCSAQTTVFEKLGCKATYTNHPAYFSRLPCSVAVIASGRVELWNCAASFHIDLGEQQSVALCPRGA